MYRTTALVSFFFFVSFAQPAAAADDVWTCAGLAEPATSEQRLIACTRLINSGKLEPGYLGQTLISRGKLYREKGDLLKAQADFARAKTLPLPPDKLIVPDFVTTVVPSVAQDKVDCRSKPANLDRSIAACTRLISGESVKESRAAAFFIRGVLWLTKREFDKAIVDFDEAAQITPASPPIYVFRGNAWRFKGYYDLAIADHTKAISLDPNYGIAYGERGSDWTEKRDYDRAIADYTRTLQFIPNNSVAYTNQAYARVSKGEFDQAILDLNEAIRLDPQNSIAVSIRGQAWLLKGDLDHAIADEDQAIQMKPSSLSFALRGDSLRYKGDLKRALEDYEQALRWTPDFIPAFTGRGLTYERMGDLYNARVQFKNALSSKSIYQNVDVSRSALETARARLAALDSGAPQPVIPTTPTKSANSSSIPTPAITIPIASPAEVEATVAKQGRRVALVIGNSAYKNVKALANPKHDAEAVSAALRRLGFQIVILVTDADQNSLIKALRTFSKEAETADWAMIYYAGHGMEVDGVNYLVPVDAKSEVGHDIKTDALPLDLILASAESAKKLKLVLLDACRDNPFASQTSPAISINVASATPASAASAASRSIGRGLAEVKVQGATLVVFAAKNGQLALDGDGADSPFAVAFLQRLATPGVEINKLFRLVRDDVMEATAGRQEPYTYGSLPGKEDFFFLQK